MATAQEAQTSEAGRRASVFAPSNAAMNELARGAEQQRTPKSFKPLQGAQQFQIVTNRLSEADPHIQDHLFAGHSALVEARQPVREKNAHVPHDVHVPRIVLHRPRVPCMCMQT